MNLSDFLTVKVDATVHGTDTATALVTRVYDDGSAAVRVLSPAGPDFDELRNYVDDQGEPYNTEEQTPTPAPTTAVAPAPTATPAATQLTPDLAAQLQQLLATLQTQQATPAASDPSSSAAGDGSVASSS